MVFGQDMCNFKNDVNKLYNMGKFVRQPIGPIGSCIKVPDPKWRLLVESTLSGLVFSFITHCAEDRNMITNLKNKKYPNLKCKIYTTNFDVPVSYVSVKPEHLIKFSCLLVARTKQWFWR